ncbi:hypothetical protein [Microbacterium sp.]|uniref:hypothetical protein n=1 Tax=Microbacterium sp. TaxID=51671 RepID=UPI003F709896
MAQPSVHGDPRAKFRADLAARFDLPADATNEQLFAAIGAVKARAIKNEFVTAVPTSEIRDLRAAADNNAYRAMFGDDGTAGFTASDIALDTRSDDQVYAELFGGAR